MKKTIFFFVGLCCFTNAFSQDTTTHYKAYNTWSLELETGMTKATKPFDTAYYTGYAKNNLFKGLQINHFGFSFRHMLNEKLGIKSRITYDNIHNFDNSLSLPFSTRLYQWTFEGVFNVIKICDMQERAGRFGLLAHTGILFSWMKTTSGYYEGQEEKGLGVLVGLTPQYRISNRSSIYMDLVANSNISQQYTWNGGKAPKNNSSVGTMYTAAIGVSISLGKHKMHGDWALTEKEQNHLEIDTLKMRVAALERSLKDGDNDGVPDYLDEEKNSLPGSYVDTHGRMLDQDSSGVPDYVENYIHTSAATNSIGTAPESSVLQMINEGYVAAYFDFSQSKPSSNSTPDIGFICNYLKTHTDKHIEIIGYTDRLGSESANRKLSLARAESVKSMLIKAGISKTRMTTKGASVDNSVERNNSEYARRLARRVVFKVN